MASIIIYQQIHFMKSRNLGFDKEQMLVLPVQSWEMMQSMSKNLAAIKKEFLSHHAIVAATATLRTPGRMEHHDNIRLLEEGAEKELGMNCLFVDNDFVSTYNIALAAGRAFRKELAMDVGNTFMINEAAVKAFGWVAPEEALGKRLAFWNWQGEIIGVTRNFHFSSLHNRIEPLFFLMPPHLFPETFTLKLSTNKLDAAVAFVASKWKEIFPDFPFEYFFLDEDFNRQYRADEEFGTIVLIFAGLAIFIACLGLFGLVSFIAERRTKEIGIRKVLGASAAKIVLLLSKDLTKWVLIANVLALPLAWYAMNRWLQNFAYHVEISWWVFALAGCLALVIALATVSTQALKAALANPVDALRYE
jgi:putative ABC transport system permease protein